jgi:glycerol dehydrogenase-like iron-containing ADH family enzyme
MDVPGDVPVDLADEAQREVELVVALPAGAGDAAHQGEKPLAHGAGRAEADEQAVHGGESLAETKIAANRFSLNVPSNPTILGADGAFSPSKEWKQNG